MRLFVENDKLAVGWIFHRFDAKQGKACFGVTLPLKLVPEGVAVLGDEPEPTCGDRFVDDDVTQALLRPSDLVPQKPKADVVLLATAHAPGGRPLTRFPVRMRVGKVDKSLLVHGPRRWKVGLLGRSGVEEAAPFTSLPLTYANALGGPKSRHNLLGIGLDTEEAHRIDDPNRPVTKPSDGPAAGFAPLAPYTEPRRGFLGTYDKKWRAERWPWFPADFDYAHFNAAPADQQVEGYLRGDEEMEFENLHPKRSTYRTRLPGLRARLFLQTTGPGDTLREIPLKLDTLWIDLDQEKALLVWRGSHPVRTPKLWEVAHLVATLEPLGQPQPASHAQTVLAAGLADEAFPAAPPPPPFDQAAFDAEFAAMAAGMAQTEAELATAETELEQLAAAQRDAILAEGHTIPQPPSPEQSLAELRESIASATEITEEQRAQLMAQVDEFAKIENEVKAMDERFARDFPPALTRDDVTTAVKAGAPLDDSGLSGLDLSGTKLDGAMLANSDLRKANLEGASLVGANLAGADFTGANLAKANLSGASLTKADFEGAALAGAVWAGATLIEANFSKANLVGVDWKNVDLTDANLREADLSKANLAGARLAGADLSDAKLEGANLTGVDLLRSSLDGIKAAQANFEAAKIAHASFAKADLKKARFVKAQGNDAVFAKATLDQATFARAVLPRSLYSDASLVETDFDRADLAGAVFDDAKLERTKLTNANLLRAGFDRSDLAEVDLRGSNAYEAGFCEAVVTDAKTDKANLRRTILG